MARKSNRDPRLDTQPLHFGMMTGDQRRAAEVGFERFTGGLREHADQQITRLRDQASRAKPSSVPAIRMRANRLEAIRDVLPTKPVSIDQAADNRIGWMKRAATTERMPHEGIGGVGYYYDHHDRLRNAVPDVPMAVAGVASPQASPGTRPEHEVGTVRAIHQSDVGGTVRMHPEVVAHLASKGVAVPRSAQGRTIPFRQLPSAAIEHLVDPKAQSMVSAHSEGVDWAAMGGTAHPRNAAAVARTLRGEVSPEEAIPSTSAPKLKGYSKNTIESEPGTPAASEYYMRAAHIGEVLRGEQPSKVNTPVKFSGRDSTGKQVAEPHAGHAVQDMLDYHGLRSSTEGQLGHGHTAEDSWQQSISVSIPDESKMKAVGDIPYKGGKTAVLRGGRKVSASPDPRVGGTAVYHAANNEATRRAAVKLESDHDLGYRVPTTLVQETGWAGARRAAGEDPEYNAARRDEEKRATRRPERMPVGQQYEQHLLTAGGSHDEVRGQMDIFGGTTRATRGQHTRPLNTAQFGEEPTGKDRVKEEAKIAAIQRNVRKKRGIPDAKALGNEPYEGWG